MLEFTNMEAAGLIPGFLSEGDPRPAVEQINAGYSHGGGWTDFKGFVLTKTDETYFLKYPGDPSIREISRATLRNETLVLFEHAWFAVIQSDGSYRVARLD